MPWPPPGENAALAAARAELRRISDAQAANRAGWETARQELESRIHAMQAELDAGRDREAALAATQGEALQRLSDSHAAERAAEDAARRDLGAAADAARAELRDTMDRHAAERAAWEDARRELEEAGRQLDARVPALEHRVDELQAVAAAKATLDVEIEDLRAAAGARDALEERVRHDLEAALVAAREDLAAAADRHEAERVAWDDARRAFEADREAHRRHVSDLERHIGQLQAVAAEKAALDAQLDGLRAAAGDRAALAEQVRELQAAVANHHELEAALSGTRSELRDATDRHGAERAAWDTSRQALETALTAARAELVERFDEETAERSAWDAARHDLEARIHELQGEIDDLREATEARAGVEASLRTVHAELQTAVERHAAERATWDTTRQDFEARLRDFQDGLDELQRAGEEKHRLEAALETAHGEVREQAGRLASERAQWDAARQDLEARLNAMDGRVTELQAAADAQRELDAALTAARTEVRQAAEAYASDRSTWETARRTLERRLQQLEHADKDRRRLEEALADARAEHDRLAGIHRQFEAQLKEATTRGQHLAAEALVLRERLESISDGTGRFRIEERLRHAQRVEEVTRLVEAMAPDLEGLMRSIDDLALRLRAELEDSDSHRCAADLIVSRTAETRGMLRQLLAFNRKQTRQVAPVDLNAAVRRAEAMLPALSGAEVEFIVTLQPVGRVAVDEDDLDQLVATLLFAGRELLTVGGSLTIASVPGSVAAGRDDDEETVEDRAGLSVTAAGYGVQIAHASPALDLLVRRCGGELALSGDPGRTAILQVLFPVATRM